MTKPARALLADAPTDGRIGWAETTTLVEKIVGQLAESDWCPNLVVALSRGGFVPATMIALKLGVQDLVGVDVRKDSDGKRSIGHHVALGDLGGRRVLIVDDGIVTGHLLPLTAETVRANGGDPRTCALVSEGRSTAPDYLAQTRAVIPVFPWE